MQIDRVPTILIPSPIDLAIINLTIQSIFVTCRYCDFKFAFIFRSFETEARDILREIPGELLHTVCDGDSIGDLLDLCWDKQPLILVPPGSLFLKEDWLPKIMSNIEKREISLIHTHTRGIIDVSVFPSVEGLIALDPTRIQKSSLLRTLPQIALGALFNSECEKENLKIGSVEPEKLGLHIYDSAIPFGTENFDEVNWKNILEEIRMDRKGDINV